MAKSKDKELEAIQRAEADDDFDYMKEIEEIEAQRREHAEQKRKKKIEAEKAEAEERAAKKTESRRERRERRNEEDWLGGEYTSDGLKPKSKKGIVAILVIIMLLIGAGGAYVIKMQADRQTISDFEDKVASFRTEKLDGVELGSFDAYFDDFMNECQVAINNGDLSKINELNGRWSEVEETYASATNGKTAMDAFVAGVTETLAPYYVTKEYKDNYDQLMKEIEEAKKTCDYESISSMQKKVDALVTNLKSSDAKAVTAYQNKIKSVNLDSDYVTKGQQSIFDEYSKKVSDALAEPDYNTAITYLKKWYGEMESASEKIAAQKESEAARLESESIEQEREWAEQESIAESIAVESIQAAEAEEDDDDYYDDYDDDDDDYSYGYDGDIFPYSSSYYLSDSDVSGLSSYELMIARNEIYARHGYIFNDPSLREYFESKSWYEGTVSSENFSATVFNSCEVANLDLIIAYE